MDHTLIPSSNYSPAALSNDINAVASMQDGLALKRIQTSIKANPTLWESLFPNKIQREHNKEVLQTMQSAHELNMAMFETQKNAMITAKKVEFEVALTAYDWVNQAKLTKLFGELESQLNIDLTALNKKTVPILIAEKKEIEIYKDDEDVYNLYKESMIHRIKAQFDMVKKLVDRFQESLDKYRNAL